MSKTPHGKLPVKRKISSGGIVFRKSGDSCDVLIASRTTQTGKKVWCLPKGLIEQGEKPEDTALREVEEETGVKGEIVEKLGDIKYWYMSRDEGVRYFKIVSFYLMEYRSGDSRPFDRELDEVVWTPIEKALGLLSYDSEREMMEKAQRILRS